MTSEAPLKQTTNNEVTPGANETSSSSSPFAECTEGPPDAVPEGALALPFRRLSGEDQTSRSKLLSPGPPPPSVSGGRDADLRALLNGWGPKEAALAVTQAGDNPILAFAFTAFHTAADGYRQGHCFNIDATLSLGGLIQPTPPAAVMETLRVPCPVTPVIATIDERPVLFVLNGNDNGDLRQVTVVDHYKTGPTGDPEGHGFAPRAWLNLCLDDHGVPAPVVDSSAISDEIFLLAGLAAAARTLLMIQDDRLAFRQEIPDERLNQARIRRGRPTLPSLWRVDARQAKELYTTRLSPQKRAASPREPIGTHISPCPHDRRGHRRRLPSGRLIWVKACHVNGTLSHMRTREFYQIEHSEGV